MDGLPVTIRLLDPPLHEFLPDLTELSVKIALAGDDGRPTQDRKLLDAVRRLHEQNPMLGLRGVRLGLVIPGLFADAGPGHRARRGRPGQGRRRPAAGDHDPAGRRGAGARGRPRARPSRCSAEVAEETGTDVHTLIGTMIEVPRAALTAGQIAAGGRVLLLRHQRPDPDGLGLLPRRRRGRRSSAATSSWASSASRRSRRSTPTASAGWSGSPSRRAGRPGPTSRSASAASTAATRTRCTSSTRPGSTTCPARRSGSRSPGWRPAAARGRRPQAAATAVTAGVLTERAR